MTIPFTCPHCGVRTDVDEQYAEQSGPCASCGNTITVPPLAGTPGYTGTKQNTQTVVVVSLIATVLLGGLLVCGGGLAFFFMRGTAMVNRIPTPSLQCTNQLKQIGLAMHNYHQVYHCFPPAYLADEDGNPQHSWRVLLLPYLGHQWLYDQYKFDEPFNSAHNLTLANSIGNVYGCPDDWNAANTGGTSYVMLVGKDTISDGTSATKIEQIHDGTSNTILLVEMSNSNIPWMEPRDLSVDDITFGINDSTPDGIRGNHGDGTVNLLLCDGSVRTVDATANPKVIEKMSTIAGRELVTSDDLDFAD